MNATERRAQAVVRAQSQIGRGIRYGLGYGGRYPDAPSPSCTRCFDEDDKVCADPHCQHCHGSGWIDTHRCDCSAFDAWCLQYPRIGWTNTDGILYDARHPGGVYELVKPAAAAPGDVLVYGSTYVNGVRRHPGHTSIIETINGSLAPGTRRWWDAMVALDCAARREAIGRRSGALWLRQGGVIARFVG